MFSTESEQFSPEDGSQLKHVSTQDSLKIQNCGGGNSNLQKCVQGEIFGETLKMKDKPELAFALDSKSQVVAVNPGDPASPSPDEGSK